MHIAEISKRMQYINVMLNCLLVLALFPFFTGCGNNKSTSNSNQSSSQLIGISDCKLFELNKVTEDVPSNKDCLEYLLKEGSILSIKHINAGFNCCPEIKTNVLTEENVIIIEEIEIDGPCLCLCLYDLDLPCAPELRC